MALRKPHERKNALFLLRRRLAILPSITDDEPFFQPPTSTQYDHLIQLLEASNAKQLHLLQPSMHLLHQLNELHITWQTTTWIVYLSHPHLAVVEATLCSLLQESWWLKNIESFEELLPLVFRAFNVVDNLDVYGKCGAFLQQIGEKQMSSVSQHCDNFTWTPTSFYHFHKALLPFLTLDSVSILTLLNRLQVIPDKNVRDTFMELHLKPKILQYIAYEKNSERSVKEVTYAVFLYYYKDNKIQLRFSEYTELLSETLKNSYNIMSLYQITTVSYTYLQFLITIELHEFNTEEFIKLSYRYLRESYSAQIIDEFGIDIIYEAIITHKPNIENIDCLSTDLTNILTDSTIYFGKRFMALQIYSRLPTENHVKNTHILTHWMEMLLSEKYVFDENTCKAFLKVHKSTPLPEEIWNVILTTQTDSVIVTLFEYFKSPVTLTILSQCCTKLLDMRLGGSFKYACDVFFHKLSLDYYVQLLDVQSFRELFKNSLHVRYLVTKKWTEMKEISNSDILKLTFEDCLLGETICTKKEKVDFIIMTEILSHENKYSDLIHQWHYYKSRTVILNSMLICSKFKPSHVLDICEAYLIKTFQKRYYLNSKIHLEKIRIYQLLLVIFHQNQNKHLYNNDVYENEYQDVYKILQMMSKYLFQENNQNDVKQFQMLLFTNLKFYAEIYKIFATELNIESRVTECVPILYHLFQYYPATKRNEEFYPFIERLLLHTMGSNYKRRCMSQMSIYYLLKFHKDMRQTTFIQTYGGLMQSLKYICESIDITSDLNYMIHFNPIRHYTAESILFDFPRLNNVCELEWQLYPYLFRELMANSSQTFCGLNFLNTDRTYSLLKPVKIKINEKLVLPSTTNRNINNLVQRKPQTDCREDFDFKMEINKSIVMDPSHDSNMGGLIVVGSLVDSAANLGGLARTCHILGAASLVIHDAQVTKTNEFKSLSMSGERWLDIQEVKVDNIGVYLQNMRSEGYSIIGAEQTNQSVLLCDHPFVYKTVLLLGSERTGIPADLLTMLSSCVEIPQYGVVRSLNVHVAAALIIYEYSQKIRTAHE